MTAGVPQLSGETTTGLRPVRQARPWRTTWSWSWSWSRAARRAALLWCASGVVGLVGMHASAWAGDRPVGPPERSIAEWLVRLQQATRIHSYVGTFVVSSASGAMSSSRIWHVCEGDVQMERVDALSGTPRTTLRRNESVVTLLPESRTMRTEQREPVAMFPNLLTPGKDFAIADFYGVRQVGQGRVAGFDADIVLLRPRDERRFGYRIWSEKRTGLVVKTQTLDVAGRVLEQAAFSELQLGVATDTDKLQRMMAGVEGYRVERSEHVRSTAQAEGWQLKDAVPGFKPQHVYRRPAPGAAGMVQWIFSDGLATVSLFLEPFDAQRHAQQSVAALGATHTLSRRVADTPRDWWVTAVGEVPPQTLQAFVDQLQRRN